MEIVGFSILLFLLLLLFIVIPGIGRLLLLLLVPFLLLSAPVVSEAPLRPPVVATPMVGISPPQVATSFEFTIQTFDGGRFTLSEQRGKIVVINFWASWAAPSRRELADLNQLYREYSDRGVVVVGINYLDSEAEARRLLSELDIQYPTGPDVGSRIAEAYGVVGIPETFVYDRAGNLNTAIRGPADLRELRSILDQLLTGDEDTP